jgi:hypothetical protein
VAAIIRWLFVVCWMGVIFALSPIASLQIPFAHSYDFVLRKLAHIDEYAILTVLLWWALKCIRAARSRHGYSPHWRLLSMESPTNGIKPGLPGAMALSAIWALMRSGLRQLCPRATPALPTDDIHMAMSEMSRHVRVSVTTSWALGAVLTTSPSCALPL